MEGGSSVLVSSFWFVSLPSPPVPLFVADLVVATFRSDYYLTEAEYYERSGGRRSSLYEGDNNDAVSDFDRSYGFNTSRSVSFPSPTTVTCDESFRQSGTTVSTPIPFSPSPPPRLYLFVVLRTNCFLLLSFWCVVSALHVSLLTPNLQCRPMYFFVVNFSSLWNRLIIRSFQMDLCRDGRRRDTDRSRIDDRYYSGPRDRYVFLIDCYESRNYSSVIC